MRALALTALLASPALAADVCHDINAGAGWQVMTVPAGQVQGVRSSGFWSVDPALTPAGTQGHGGPDATVLATRTDPRPFSDARFGALLVRFEAAGQAQVMDWTRFHGAVSQSGVFNMNVGQIAFRINEGDAELADNDGTLTVCFEYLD
ncbi:hypothetical protein [Antarctobacter heliothermus]|uniref:Uncharacterized protein n=1 Tax=Antarctobacter heliothermus TaxID=74033 RepID=A0A239I3H3_9RHOB|nr:hypothetical protein [Antarctobacter heliothermus]SNS88165.1 hypothetical protein SAMN04488078_103920 [Antarctobacter heliothermus]